MTGIHRMASADVAWLHMDRPTNLMVVNCVFWFDEPLDWDRVVAAFAERLVPAFPRFAQRAADPPVTVGLITPTWRDVPDFDVADHVRRVTLPAPGTDPQLHAYVSAQADVPLDPRRPLWEAHFIDGYRGAEGRPGSAVLLRTHHAIADGTALVQALLTLVDDPSGDGHPDQLPRPGRATPTPSLLSRTAGTLRQFGVVTSGALAVMGHLPTAVEQRWLDLFAGRATAVVTNIAGPREEVSLAGVTLRGFTAWVPSTGPVGVGLSICSYAGQLLLGVAVDEARVPDSDLLLAALHDEVADLRQLSG
jgi:hypothetical protein